MTNIFPVSHSRKGKVKWQGWAWNKERRCPQGEVRGPPHPEPKLCSALPHRPPGASGEGSGIGLPEEVVKRSGSCAMSIEGVSRFTEGLCIIKMHTWFLLSRSLPSDNNTHDPRMLRRGKDKGQVRWISQGENPSRKDSVELSCLEALCA